MSRTGVKHLLYNSITIPDLCIKLVSRFFTNKISYTITTTDARWRGGCWLIVQNRLGCYYDYIYSDKTLVYRYKVNYSLNVDYHDIAEFYFIAPEGFRINIKDDSSNWYTCKYIDGISYVYWYDILLFEDQTPKLNLFTLRTWFMSKLKKDKK